MNCAEDGNDNSLERRLRGLTSASLLLGNNSTTNHHRQELSSVSYQDHQITPRKRQLQQSQPNAATPTSLVYETNATSPPPKRSKVE